jgi:hypothetical protein
MAKTKGTTIVALVKFLRRHRDAAERRLPPPLRHYLDDRIHVASWYPEEDLRDLARAVAPMFPADVADPFEAMGRASAREHLEGTYGHLFAETDDPLAIPARAFALWASMHDSGRLATSVESPNAVRVELLDFALPSPEMCGIVGGYLAETLRLVGFSAPCAEPIACRLDGMPSCVWRCHWIAGEGVAGRG